MSANSGIIPLTAQKVPTILSYDLNKSQYIIGDEARALGLKGRTNTFNFKPDLGEGDVTFSQKKKYWIGAGYDVLKHRTTDIRTLSAKEATTYFLQELLRGVKVPGEIIIGEPAERDQAWKDNFRRHMREILEEVYGVKPQFLPEPFAVFQYYRHYEQVFSAVNRPETILIIDIGGGTFNSCIIATTESGYLSRGGAKSVPYGLQAEFCGGSLIDKELLVVLVERAKQQGIRWKDDPIARAERSEIPVLLHLEDAKIHLSNAMGDHARVADDFSTMKTVVHLEKGSLHPDEDIHIELTGEDLKLIIRKMWRRSWGELITKTITEAKKKIDFQNLDKVLVAGGSSRLPFMREELHLPVRSLVPIDQIYFGVDTGNAVAFGIACECREQFRKYPNLSVEKVASCLLNDLYIGFRKTRKDKIVPPKKTRSPDGSISKVGQLLSAPFETEELKLVYKVELPFEPESRIIYSFSEESFADGDDEQECLNINNDVVSVKANRKYNKKCDLQLEFKKNGMVKPTFYFIPASKNAEPERVECAEFYMDNLRVREGQEFLGIDFGTSNSYVVRFLSTSDEIQTSDYPEYKVNKVVMDELRKTEEEILDCRGAGILNSEAIEQYARDKILVNVFHSNKIEGNPLTKGETEIFVVDQNRQPISRQEKEAKNLITAYNWMIDNVDYINQDPEGFIRNINKMILEGIVDGGGEYRQKTVTISGMSFVPPVAASVSPLMQSLGQELKKGLDDRSAIEFSIAMHTKLVSIHPFVDANGRTARLLMNAILLANKLPVVVINFDDKQRYLDALSSSNKGDISPLVEFVIECFRHQLDELRHETKLGDIVPEETISEPVEPKKEDPIRDAFIEIGLPLSDDPLRIVMKERIQEISKIKEAEYESWKQAFSTVLFETRSIIEEFNASYRTYGFQMQLIEFDMLSFEKYLDILQARKVSKTWFYAVQIDGPFSSTKVLFFFEHAPNDLDPELNIHNIIMTLVRFDGTTYQRLLSEPITLREIGFAGGQLIFLGADGRAIADSTTGVLRTLLAELIKAYVRIK